MLKLFIIIFLVKLWSLDTTESHTNDNLRNFSSSPELISHSNANDEGSQNSSSATVDITAHLGSDATATSSQNKAQGNIDFKVIYNKQKINVNFPIDGTVSELKNYLQNIIAVPQAMQKVMFKGLAKDDQTLRNLGVDKGNVLI